jgi:hypothetical protein
MRRHNDSKTERAAWFLLAFFLMLAVLLAAAILTRPVRAEELSEIPAKLAAYCSLYSREMVLIQILHPTESIVADTDVILELAKKEYGDCLAVLPTLLPLPAELGSLKSWLADMRDLLIERSGRKPATDPPPDPPEAAIDPPVGEAAWRQACAAKYRTWNPADETVIRPESKGGQQRCPLELIDGEWRIPGE